MIVLVSTSPVEVREDDDTQRVNLIYDNAISFGWSEMNPNYTVLMKVNKQNDPAATQKCTSKD